MRLRRVADFPITLFGAVSLVAYVMAAIAHSPPGAALRVLMLPAYVIHLVIASTLGRVLQPFATPLYWLLSLPLYFAPFLLFDLALARASRAEPGAGGKGLT
jgi:hypothetical protein